MRNRLVRHSLLFAAASLLALSCDSSKPAAKPQAKSMAKPVAEKVTRTEVLHAMVTLERFAEPSMRAQSEANKTAIREAIEVLREDTTFGAKARRYRIYRRYSKAGYPEGMFSADFIQQPSGPECCASNFVCHVEMDPEGLGGSVAYSMDLVSTDRTLLVQGVLDPQAWSTAINPPFTTSKYIRTQCDTTGNIDDEDTSTAPTPGSPWSGALREIFQFNDAAFGTTYVHNILDIDVTTTANSWHMDYGLCPGGSVHLNIPDGPPNGTLTVDGGHSTATTSGPDVHYDGLKEVMFHFSVGNGIRENTAGCLVERMWPILTTLAMDSAVLFCKDSTYNGACGSEPPSCGLSTDAIGDICRQGGGPAVPAGPP